jgi:PAS domain S-box-containing protein
MPDTWWYFVAIAAAAVVVAAVVGGRLARHRVEASRGLQVEQLRLLHRAELAVATAPSPYAAAKELAGHAMALLDAPAAIVLLEAIGGTERVSRGDTDAADLYGPGSRMRLMDDDGTPVGSIAVAARTDGREYDARDEEVLDALAQRVSATLHRLSLFEAVQQERGALADILDSSSDGILAVASDLRVTSWNPAMARLTGTSAEEAIGRPCCAVFRPTGEDGGARYGAACPCRASAPVELLVSIDRPDGPRWLNIAVSPRAGGGAVLVARDVTARKQVEDEKADFLATVSHELRTPLTPLKGFLQTLLRRGDDFEAAERHHVYEVMLREEQRLERLVEQLLQATSLDQGRNLDVQPVDLAALVAERAADLRRQDPSRTVTVDLPVGGDGRVGVLADLDVVAVVVDNLLSNTRKYAPAGTPVLVRVSVDGDDVVTSVEDAGPGVPAEDRARIFDKFTRLGDHLTRPQQGVGLGLYIVRRSVEAMGGTVEVGESSLGGAAFRVRLPAAELAPVLPGADRELIR